MFAVIRTGGKQYRVASGDVVTVEKLAGEPGEIVTFGEVLMAGEGAAAKAGAPLLEGALVSATIVAQGKADKVLIFKKRRRHNYRRLRGHRQPQTILKIGEISAGSATE
ncbi:MAG: 50S ribosomal protein L21 [Stellaceae bacterium]